ncbi:cytochrome c biogenesis protein CcdA [Kovacikia minuta CCNUW1]|uniref:cytochrome c biogenesis CcdA family protein n=1 Tax=Kovacikia minuta TaxID=2931930 RepID=UPI001CCE391B|nr:cytochrome c biogenesis protein CcdA [Kovacikia minuta]UBF26886.1 cytochrome c biogenesis protein CcdA [Kovacikia minuta CCNUW1]
MLKPPRNLNLAKFRPSKLVLLISLGAAAAFLVFAVDYLNRGELLMGFDNFVTDLGSNYRQWFRQQPTSNLLVLLPLSFFGGLVASISPCILSMLPVNLSYIGTREFTSRWDAFFKAGAFVLGVVTVLSLFGLFSSFQGLVLIKYQGYFQIAVGMLIILMGLSMAGVLKLPMPQTLLGRLPNLPQPKGEAPSIEGKAARFSFRRGARSLLMGPYGIGLTFALVSSPCTSPVTFAVLAAASATGSLLQSTLAMISYALGYTAIIFFASLFTGLIKQTRGLLTHSEMITRIASLTLLLVGGFYLLNGSRWLLASLRLT